MADDVAAAFQPDYTPEQMESLGVYDALYRGQGPRLASLGEWKPEWVSEHDPKGWAQWYKRYSAGRRLEGEDERQIKRWLSFKARHGGPFMKNPTPKRGWALRNWGIDPAKLVAVEEQARVAEMLDDYKTKAMQKYVQERVKQSLALPAKLAAVYNFEGDVQGVSLRKTLHKVLDELKHPGLAYNNARTGEAIAVLPGSKKKQQEILALLRQRLADRAAENKQLTGRPGEAKYKRPLQEGVDYKITPRPEVRERMYPVTVTPEAIQKFIQLQGFNRLAAENADYQKQWLTERYRLQPDAAGNLTGKVPGLAKKQLLAGEPIYDYQLTPGWQDVKAAELNPDIQLQEHQQRIADRTLEENPRMLVYHGLGSGKSLSAIAAAEAAKKQFGDNYGIAVPASLRGNFQKEINKFTRGSDPEIMSYTGLALGKQFQEPPATLIMDEAHRLRNPDAASSRGAQAAAQAAKRVLLLTGSPITNSPSDLANLLGMLHNKKITPEEFEKRYIGYKKVNPGILNWFRGIKPGEQPEIKNEAELRELLKGKVDYQPSKTPEGVNVNEEVVRVPLSPQQQKIQKAIRTKVPPGFLWKLDQEFPLSRDELAKLNSFLTGMRQVSLSTQPFRADKDPAKAFEQSAKLQEAFKRLKETLDSDKRKKAIIYSNFIDSGLAPYAAGLEQAGVPHAFFHGGVSPKARQKAVEAYNKGKLRALLIGPAGAEGLSTKGTSLIQLMDPHWHESRSQQARGRGLRFDSHRDLPEELKNVAVQRFISSSEDPSWLGKLMGYSRERTGDEVLEHLTAEKEKLNDVFRKVLREEGTQKAAAHPTVRAFNALPSLWQLAGGPKVTNAVNQFQAKAPVTEALVRMGAGGAAGWHGQDKYLDLVAPDISDEGRMRANIKSLGLGALLASTGRRRVPMNPITKYTLTGGLLGRHLLLQPTGAAQAPIPMPWGLGSWFDPGKSKMPRLLADIDSPEKRAPLKEKSLDPVGAFTRWVTNKGYDTAVNTLVRDEKGNPTKLQNQIAETLKTQTMPTVYQSIISSLGGNAPADASFADVGTTLAPHLAGGAGGAYLGYRLGDTLGNFMFADKPSEDYERRRRQEDRRWWLQFLGGNLGAVGGTIAAAKAMPKLQEIIRNLKANPAAGPTPQPGPAIKQAASPWARLGKILQTRLPFSGDSSIGRTIPQSVGDAAFQSALGAGTTAAQYQLGLVPGAQFDAQGKELSPVSNPGYLAALTAMNTLAARPFTRHLRYKGMMPAKNVIDKGLGFKEVPKNRLANTAALSAAWVGGGPTATHYVQSVPSVFDLAITGTQIGGLRDVLPKPLQKIIPESVLPKVAPAVKPGSPEEERSLPFLIGQLSQGDTRANAAAKAQSRATEVFKEEIGKKDWQSDAAEGLKTLATKAELPGFSEENSLKKMLGSAGLATLGQGLGVASGGVLGMVGGDWLTDKILNTAVDRGWIKKKKNWHRFLRDLGSLAGAGVGAYGALRAMDYGIPAAQAYYAKKQQQENAAQQPASV